jgi:hypothetical protein
MPSGLGIAGPGNLHPGQDHLMTPEARPGDHREGDAAEPAGGHGIVETRVSKREDEAVDLCSGILDIDRFRAVERNHDGDIDRLGPLGLGS